MLQKTNFGREQGGQEGARGWKGNAIKNKRRHIDVLLLPAQWPKTGASWRGLVVPNQKRSTGLE